MKHLNLTAPKWNRQYADVSKIKLRQREDYAKSMTKCAASLEKEFDSERRKT